MRVGIKKSDIRKTSRPRALRFAGRHAACFLSEPESKLFLASAEKASYADTDVAVLNAIRLGKDVVVQRQRKVT